MPDILPHSARASAEEAPNSGHFLIKSLRVEWWDMFVVQTIDADLGWPIERSHHLHEVTWTRSAFLQCGLQRRFP